MQTPFRIVGGPCRLCRLVSVKMGRLVSGSVVCKKVG